MSRIRDEIHEILHDPLKVGLLMEEGKDLVETEVVELFVREFSKLRNHYDPKCSKCGVRKSVVTASQKQNETYVKCLPMGREEWFGNERHQFKSVNRGKL